MQKKPWIGAWKLISCEGRCDGSVTEQWYGPNPFGRLIYDHSGEMTAFISLADRHKLSSDDPLSVSDEEKVSCFDRFLAYCGKYEFSDDGKVQHHVEGSFFPNWIGKTHVRYYELKENRLELRTEKIVRDGNEMEFFLIWERCL